MSIFKKPSESGKKLSKEDIIKAINALSDEEQNELYEDLLADLEKQEGETDTDTTDDSKDNAEAKGESETEKQIDKAEDDIAEKGADSQTEKDRIDESVGEQEKIDGNEGSQDAKDRVDESIGESEAERVEKEDSEEVNSALGARISALEEQLASLAERMEQMLSNLENNKDFGAHPGSRTEKPANEDDEAYMDAYYAKQPRRK